PALPAIDGIRCVAFDIYGTLFISGSGDIGHSDAGANERALRDILAAHGIAAPAGDASLTARFTAAIAADHDRSRKSGIDFPEVEIRDIWRELLGDHPDDLIESVAVAYECACNPVWPMPGALDLLTALKDRGLALAIVSNAQFYTPFLFEGLLDRSIDDLGFDPDLSFFSCRFKRAKPSAWLYEQLRDALTAQSIAPEEVLYVGNDALKDIHPAAQTGFRTALFAGDRRSLRLREDHPEPLLPPDAIVTALAQIPTLIP
ncbi:MAG: HAD family hydrolase, partial [Akkermansiaceae bacterium]|nr:HAD family hydrolase [Akkermansiaceae bacterium]